MKATALSHTCRQATKEDSDRTMPAGSKASRSQYLTGTTTMVGEFTSQQLGLPVSLR